jgi:hypothetical protein
MKNWAIIQFFPPQTPDRLAVFAFIQRQWMA